MPSNRWLDRTQPQTLMMATILMYMNAVLGLIDGFVSVWLPFSFVVVVGQIPAGWGVANEKKWGYWLAVVLSAAQIALTVLVFSFAAILNLAFFVALLALLLHPQSRSYRRTWFR